MRPADPRLRRERLAFVPVAVLAALLLSLPIASPPARAERAPFDFYDRGTYRSDVPRPADVLGYPPGTFHTSYGNMERYVDAVAHVAPDRVRREPFGRTYEFRERALLIVSSPKNLERLEEIRVATAKLADPRQLADEAEAENLIRRTPATVWLNYSIHGDESASFEAMAQVLYQLAAGEDSTTLGILDRCVVILNLAHNPDGHERFVTWINALGSGNPEPWALEQQRQQPWGIGGRTNHYQVDLNRDALAMSQVESRQIARAFRRWRPQVFVDHHGQTATYFFAPPATPINPTLSSAEVKKWTELFGRANAAAFDRYGWNYYVRDVFDLYYPGYWDAWPSLQGAVGMTYETDGGGNLAIRRDDETVVTLLDGIERHFTASLATCEAAASMREARLRDFHRFALAAMAEGRRGPERAFAFEPGADPVRAAALAENLLNAGVEVQWVTKAFRSAAARPVWQDVPAPKPAPGAAKGAAKGAAADPRGGMVRLASPPPMPHAFERGAFVVDLAQPASRLARTLIERDAPMDSAFAQAQLEKYQRNLKRGRRAPTEDYDFYDVTAWSLPVTYDVPVWSLSELPPAGRVLAPPDPTRPDPSDEVMPDSLAIGVPLTARVCRFGPLELHDAAGAVALDLHGSVEGGRARTAYVWGYDGEGAARLALRLLQEGFKVATTTRPMRAAERDYPRGSFIARIERNPATLHERIAALARSSGVRVFAVHSAYTDRGDTGVGSEAVVSLKRPRIAVLADRPIANTSFGWIWFLLERRLGVPFTAVRAGDLARVDLGRYDVVVVPDGGAEALAGALGGGIGSLKDWIGRGGVLLCLDEAAELPTLKSVGLTRARVVGVKPADKKEDEDKAPPDTLSEDERRPQYLPGTVFLATPDPRHFLCWGLEDGRLPVLIQGRTFLKPSSDGANPLMFDRGPLALSGWVWPETERRAQGTAYAVDEPVDRGHVILIDGAPAFRLFWRSTERLILNALLFAPALD